jgi:hypothetical protein
MNRLVAGAALGGLAVYFYDPEMGETRRGRLISVWQENRDSAMQARRVAANTLESARPIARRMTKAVGRTDWSKALDRGRSAATLPKLIGAAAIGGVLVYFLDPTKGSERRMSALDAGRRASRQVADVVTSVSGRVGEQVAGTVQEFRSQVG